MSRPPRPSWQTVPGAIALLTVLSLLPLLIWDAAPDLFVVDAFLAIVGSRLGDPKAAIEARSAQ
jgi:hypothetical protein